MDSISLSHFYVWKESEILSVASNYLLERQQFYYFQIFM